MIIISLKSCISAHVALHIFEIQGNFEDISLGIVHEPFSITHYVSSSRVLLVLPTETLVSIFISI